MFPLSRCLRIRSSRALVCDVLYFGRQVPTFVHSRQLCLGTLAELRAGSPRRISWTILMAKAYGLLALEVPVLRQTWMKWPWPHLYQSPHSVATIALSRQHACEERLCWLRLKRPETYSLVELQQSLERHQREPVEVAFRRQLQISRLPAFVRRLAWRTTMLSGPKRALRLGTFAMTTLAAEGVEIEQPPAIHTSTLTFGPLDEQGRLRAAIAYDHRLMDGVTIARCLARLEAILLGPIAAELRQMGGRSAEETLQQRLAS
jgi:hypothetical protein